MKISAAIGLVIVAAALPSGASAAVLFDQTAGPGANYTYSMDYPKPNDVEAADDFTVPPGQQWTINEVDVLGTGGSFKTHIQIYSDAGGLPGPPIYNADELTATGGPNFNTVLPTPAVLGPGTYWLSVKAPDYWSWRNTTANSGGPAVWQNPSNEFVLIPVTGCGKAWTTRGTCYETPAEPGQAFKLIGPDPTILPTTTTKPSNAFTLGAFKKNRKKGTGTLTVNVPGPGTLTLSGTGLKAVTLAVTAAGDVQLTLKATGKARKKLRKKGKAKVQATLVFTPTGGDPATQTKSVTLKKKKKRKKAASSK
jgi:hypothetical protein